MQTRAEQETRTVDIKKLIWITVLLYLLFVVSFYFLTGDQLRYRDSRGNIQQLTADTGTEEMTEGNLVEQVFSARIQRIRSVSVQFGTYIRNTNQGTVTIELLRDRDGALLLRQSFDVSTIPEGAVMTVAADKAMDGVYLQPLRIRVYGDSLPGFGVSPLRSLSTWEGDESARLFINGEPAEGTLCFEAAGIDEIWTGRHYWEIAAGFAALLLLFWMVSWQRVKRGRRSFILGAINAVMRYWFLIKQLVGRDFKTKYKRSVLGVFWSFLNPLLMMTVQYFVFSTLFKSDIPNFAAYLIIGTVMFNFFSESCSMTLVSILGNAGLITKVYMPKYIYPLTRTISSVVNLGISLIPLMLVCLFTGVHMTKAAILSLFFFVCLIIFCLGLGMLLATSMVFFRDTQFLWGVCTMMWMYATPIFYPESILPPNLKFVHQLNPLYHFLRNARICILDGISPEPIVYAQCLLIALGMLMIGAAIFYKNQDKFILYL